MKKNISNLLYMLVALSSFLVSCGSSGDSPTVDNKTVLDPQDYVAHVYANFNSVTSPLNFEQDRLERDNVVIDRLIEIRAAQEAYRREHGRYAANFDELIAFLGDSMTIVNKSYILNDDQLADIRDFKVEDTKPNNPDEMGFTEDEAYGIVQSIIEESKNANKNKRGTAIKRLQKLDKSYKNEDAPDLKIADAFRCETIRIAYVDTLFHNPNYDLQQLRYIPFSQDENGHPVEFFMQADSLHTRSSANCKSGGYIHVFESRADFIQYLKGLDELELNNYLLEVITNGTEYREIERVDKNGEPLEDEDGNILKRKIPCRKVGDITKNNNNAGNWPNR